MHTQGTYGGYGGHAYGGDEDDYVDDLYDSQPVVYVQQQQRPQPPPPPPTAAQAYSTERLSTASLQSFAVAASPYSTRDTLYGLQEQTYGSERQLNGSARQLHGSTRQLYGSAGRLLGSVSYAPDVEVHRDVPVRVRQTTPMYLPPQALQQQQQQKKKKMSAPQYKQSKPSQFSKPSGKQYPTNKPTTGLPRQMSLQPPEARSNLRGIAIAVLGVLIVLVLLSVSVGVYIELSNNSVEQELQIIGEVTIRNLQWSENFKNPDSEKYLNLKELFCTEMQNILTTTLDTVEACTLLKLAAGSIVVEYQLDVTMRRNIPTTENSLFSQASSRIRNGLIASSDFRIDKADIIFTDGDQCEGDPCPTGTTCFDKSYDYECGCEEGYDFIKLSMQCIDIDECKLNSPCESSCQNTVGSFLCSCEDGYTLARDGRLCQDMNECADVNYQHGCEHTCVDDIPGYHCACNTGYGLLADGRTCKDFNECASNDHGCDHVCTNLAGSFECSCNEEYYLWTDGRTCKPMFDSLTTEPIGVDRVTILAGSSTVLGCSLPVKDPEAIKLIRWRGPRGDVVAIDKKLSDNEDISMASQYDAVHQASLLGFTNQYGGPTDVEAGEYVCSYTVADIHVELTITVVISECSSEAGFVMCQDRKHCILQSQLCDGTPHCPSTGDDEILHCATPPANSDTCSGYLCEDGGCIETADRCDGTFNCTDGSDEKNCGECPVVTHYLCRNGACLDRSQEETHCNSHPDCPDRSDEPARCACLQSQHFCDDKCKPASIVCDDQNDCMDGSDERNCNCAAGQFECSDGQCLPDSRRMDGTEDCADGADEVAPACSASEFQCSDMSCIPLLRAGDKVNDCGDWSDEITDDCPEGLMHCENGACLWRSAALYHCDGLQQCPDGSDETPGCSCLPGDQHDCGDRCIPALWVGDGEFDCTDKSDEEIPDFPCSESTHRCPPDDRCIPQAWLCDGHEDCADGSDETCGAESTDPECEDDMFQCPASLLCIPIQATCDGNNHCGDFGDELLESCPACTSAHFVCENGACIDQDRKCDGHRDCLDGEDELFCPCEEFQCPDGRCIAQQWRCDNVNDCDDGSDEQNCRTCRANQFQCFNFDCIPNENRCDGTDDCSDASDEFNCARRTTPHGIVTLTSRTVEGPVCSTDWQTRWGNDICSIIGKGYMMSSSTSALANNQQGYLTVSNTASSHLDLTAFQHSTSCASGSVVTVNCESLSCGARSPRLGFQAAPYIINGHNADEGEWPWHIAMAYKETFKCGGVIINNEWILTAAHCVEITSNANAYTITSGSRMRSGRGFGSSTQTARTVVLHPQYSARKIEYDIALVRLSAPLPFSDHIRPICLHDSDTDLSSFVECYATGWGLTRKGGVNPEPRARAPNPEQLQEAKMQIISAARCNDMQTESVSIEDNVIVDSTMICGGYTDGFIATCNGDSGGPLACKDHHGLWSVVGLTSWGNTDCATFTAFTRVSVFNDWITKTIAMNQR